MAINKSFKFSSCESFESMRSAFAAETKVIEQTLAKHDIERKHLRKMETHLRNGDLMSSKCLKGNDSLNEMMPLSEMKTMQHFQYLPTAVFPLASIFAFIFEELSSICIHFVLELDRPSESKRRKRVFLEFFLRNVEKSTNAWPLAEVNICLASLWLEWCTRARDETFVIFGSSRKRVQSIRTTLPTQQPIERKNDVKTLFNARGTALRQSINDLELEWWQWVYQVLLSLVPIEDLALDDSVRSIQSRKQRWLTTIQFVKIVNNALADFIRHFSQSRHVNSSAIQRQRRYSSWRVDSCFGG